MALYQPCKAILLRTGIKVTSPRSGPAVPSISGVAPIWIRWASKLEGKACIITGGSHGIGKQVCRQLLIKKAKVCIADIDINEGEKTVQELKSNFPKSEIFLQQCDVTKEAEFEETFKVVQKRCGSIDILVNNAGIAGEKRWRDMINVNFIGLVTGCHLAFKYLQAADGTKGGTVINTASIVGIKAFVMSPMYTATKHAVAGFTKCWGDPSNVAKTKVKMSAVCPEAANTKFLEAVGADSVNEELGKQLLEYIGKKVLDPLFVSTAFIKLLEDDVTGQLLVASLTRGLYYQSYEHYK